MRDEEGQTCGKFKGVKRAKIAERDTWRQSHVQLTTTHYVCYAHLSCEPVNERQTSPDFPLSPRLIVKLAGFTTQRFETAAVKVAQTDTFSQR